MKIHPSAIVESGAELGEDVEIGPGAVVSARAKIGPRCKIQAHAVLENRVTLGSDNFVGYGAVLGAAPQDFAHNDSVESEVRIGDGNTLREYVTIHRGTKQGTATRVGNRNFIMAGAHFGHNVCVGNRTVIANNCLLAGYVEIHDGAVLGGGTVFHQFMRVGRLCMVRGGTRFGKDIPPFLVANGENQVTGLNAVGLRRSGMTLATRLELKRLFKLIFWSNYNVTQALEAARAQQWGPEAQQMIDFIASAKKRSICYAVRPSSVGEEDDEEE